MCQAFLLVLGCNTRRDTALATKIPIANGRIAEPSRCVISININMAISGACCEAASNVPAPKIAP